ncbi:MAG: hypothetical protein IPP46_03600 [Bacteroidetes bacterium]|nr:hypothetical protein [Bacteroidota bacterium]
MTNNTAESFFSKWKNNPSLAFKETVEENSEIEIGYLAGMDLEMARIYNII